jgi:hypothetical protein
LNAATQSWDALIPAEWRSFDVAPSLSKQGMPQLKELEEKKT